MEGCRLTVNDLACRRGDRVLFRKLSFELTAGEALQVVGPNGTGKSSLLRILAGLLGAFAGTVERSGAIGLVEDGDIIEIDADVGTLNVKLSDQELAQRKTKWSARATNHTTGALWKYAQQVGPAVGGAVTHPGGAHEKQCYADI